MSFTRVHTDWEKENGRECKRREKERASWSVSGRAEGKLKEKVREKDIGRKSGVQDHIEREQPTLAFELPDYICSRHKIK